MKPCAATHRATPRFGVGSYATVTRDGSFLLKFAAPMLQIAQKPQLCPFWQGLCSRHLLASVANFREVRMETMTASVQLIDHPGSRELAEPAALKGVKVMVIDDSNTIRRSAEIFLLQAGCTVILADDGFDALAKITDHQPDLIFVDIMMPRLDGYQTCALIKKNAKFHQTPVVMLSSKDGLFDRARGRMVGSDQYLTKPFTKESLLKAVATHVKAAAQQSN
jgi:twitching motility two-component system response regulator PilG